MEYEGTAVVSRDLRHPTRVLPYITLVAITCGEQQVCDGRCMIEHIHVGVSASPYPPLFSCSQRGIIRGPDWAQGAEDAAQDTREGEVYKGLKARNTRSREGWVSSEEEEEMRFARPGGRGSSARGVPMREGVTAPISTSTS